MLSLEVCYACEQKVRGGGDEMNDEMRKEEPREVVF